MHLDAPRAEKTAIKTLPKKAAPSLFSLSIQEEPHGVEGRAIPVIACFFSAAAFLQTCVCFLARNFAKVGIPVLFFIAPMSVR